MDNSDPTFHDILNKDAKRLADKEWLHRKVEAEIRAEIKDLEEKLSRRRAELASHITGISKGDIIEWDCYGNKKIRAVVESVELFESGHCVFHVRALMKGGKVSANVRTISDFSSPRKVESACTPDLPGVK